MTDRLHLLPRHRKILESLLREHLPGVEVWAYGSRVNGRSHDGSDLDLVLRGPDLQEIPLGQLGDFEEAVRESTIPFLVEARDWSRLPKRFYPEIERGYVVLVKGERQSLDNVWRELPFSEAVIINPRIILERGKTYPHVDMAAMNPGSRNVYASVQRKYTGGGSRFQSGDTLMARITPCLENGKIALYRATHTQATAHGSTEFIVIRGRTDVTDSEFAYYLTQWEGVRSHAIDQMTGTSGRQRVPTDSLNHLTVSIPPLPEQRAIAHILGTLDDKIELNRRTNETLESMARALFKSWFIDFDPVRAKMTLKHHSPPQHHSPLEGESQSAIADVVGGLIGPSNAYTQKKNLNRAKSLRYNQTDAEGLLWHYLRKKQLDGHKFRRQQPVGPYIVDFACLPEKLLIELDGGQHAEQETYDEQRDQFLQSQGYRVLRFWNNEVFDNCFAVLEQIYQTLNHSPFEGESAIQGQSPPESRWGDQNATDPDLPPPHQPSPDGSPSATPPQGGSDWTVERARAYLDRMDPEIAALFPDRLVDSELGEIPEGWEVKMLGDCFHLTMGQSPPGSTYNDDRRGLPFFQGRTDFRFRYPENRKYCTAPTRIAERDDTLVSVRAPVGDINMAWEKCCAGRGVAVLRHASGSRSFTYYSAWTIQQQLKQYEHTGTVFGAINKKQFEALTVVEPTSEIVSLFESQVGPLDEHIRKGVAQSKTLTQARDTLLPKLISGEIRLPNIKQFTETSQ